MNRIRIRRVGGGGPRYGPPPSLLRARRCECRGGTRGMLVRFGVSIPRELLERYDRMVRAKGYTSRSEALRDLIRNALVEQEWQEEREVAGTLTLVYDHHTGDLPGALTGLQHEHHHLIVSVLHVHLDRHTCLEVLVVRGKPRELRGLADRLGSLKGVKHSRLTTTTLGKDLG